MWIAFAFLCVLSIVIFLPLLLTFCGSFMSSAEINAHYQAVFYRGDGTGNQTTSIQLIPEIVSFSQYNTVLFQSPEYLFKFWNSLMYALPITILQVILALLAAYSFARFPGKGKSVLLFFYTVLMLMPYQVTMVPNYIVVDRLGLLNSKWAIWLPGITAPFSVYLLTKFMRKIPMSFYEAAKVDGAGEWKIFTRISVPMSKSAIAATCILVFIDYWNMVEQPILMLTDMDLHPLSVYLSKINAEETGVAFAVAIVYMVIPILVFLYGEDDLVEGIIYSGGVKG